MNKYFKKLKYYFIRSSFFKKILLFFCFLIIIGLIITMFVVLSVNDSEKTKKEISSQKGKIKNRVIQNKNQDSSKNPKILDKQKEVSLIKKTISASEIKAKLGLPSWYGTPNIELNELRIWLSSDKKNFDYVVNSRNFYSSTDTWITYFDDVGLRIKKSGENAGKYQYANYNLSEKWEWNDTFFELPFLPQLVGIPSWFFEGEQLTSKNAFDWIIESLDNFKLFIETAIQKTNLNGNVIDYENGKVVVRKFNSGPRKGMFVVGLKTLENGIIGFDEYTEQTISSFMFEKMKQELFNSFESQRQNNIRGPTAVLFAQIIKKYKDFIFSIEPRIENKKFFRLDNREYEVKIYEIKVYFNSIEKILVKIEVEKTSGKAYIASDIYFGIYDPVLISLIGL